MCRFLVLVEVHLVKQYWSKAIIWKALVHVRDQWVFPRTVNAALWNAEHASQASQVANRLHQLNGTFKVQAAVDTALKNEVIEEALTLLAKMLSSRKKKAMSKKVIMRFMALLDDMNGNVFVGNF